MAVDLLVGLGVGRRGTVVSSGDVVIGIVLANADWGLWVGRWRIANRGETSARVVR